MQGSLPNALTRDARANDSRARRRRWRALPTLASVAVVLVCVAAGEWQHRRMNAKEALRAQQAAASQRPAAALADLPSTTDWSALRYAPATATGEFIASRQFLVDNRVHAGRAGFHVVTPLRLVDGRVVLVNRGWIAQGASRADLPSPAPPRGVVTVRGRVSIPSRGYLELSRDDSPGALWQNLDPARFAAATGLKLMPVVLEAAAPAGPDDGLVREWPAPDYGVDTHRIYMMQWYAFAALAIVLWLWFHRPARRRAGDG